jgi:predicted NBD/HSP70 family sugar kinase
MRRINPSDFRVAKRGTSREINRQIALTLVRTRQPISRADLARVMGLRRGAVTLLVNELIAAGLIFEGAKGESKRGRKPKYLFIDSRQRCAVAIDIRVSRTFILITDLVGQPLLPVSSFPTNWDPAALVAELAKRIERVLTKHPEVGACEGIGMAVPGMVDRHTSRVMHAPTLGWRDVDLVGPLQAATGLPVFVENSVKACALAQVWSVRNPALESSDLVFVGVSDGVGVGIVIDGKLMRGRDNIAGEFGHVPISADGPACSCGGRGCWEVYVSNVATLSRYLGRDLADRQHVASEALTVDDIVIRARAGEGRALAALQETGRYLGYGLANIVKALNPHRICIGGEITAGWDLIEGVVHEALGERTLIAAAAQTEILTVPVEDHPRLRGAAALVTAPAFAAPVVA